jgi:hypothetical protein
MDGGVLTFGQVMVVIVMSTAGFVVWSRGLLLSLPGQYVLGLLDSEDQQHRSRRARERYGDDRTARDASRPAAAWHSLP